MIKFLSVYNMNEFWEFYYSKYSIFIWKDESEIPLELYAEKKETEENLI